MDAYASLISFGDVLFGWLLRVPTDLALLIVACLTSFGFALIRKYATDQDLLRRCKQDKKRLAELRKEAKARSDKEAIARHRATETEIGIKLMHAEFKPTLIALPLVAFLAMWCFERLEFDPPRAQEPVTVSFHLPVSNSGDLIHLVPMRVQDDGREALASGPAADTGWLCRLKKEEHDPLACEAVWRVNFQEPGEYRLRFRHADRTYVHPLRIGAPAYAPARTWYPERDARCLAWTRLPERKLFGVVPGFPALAMAPWMSAYLILVLALMMPSRWMVKAA